MDKFLQTTVRWSFYSLFFLVPLVFYSKSHELFEYNKMMLVYGLTVIIVGAWISKMILAKKIIFKRTFLDIPIILYLGSHVLSTLFSIDIHTSIWGYYSRFHEGLLATISYLCLYYALVSNLSKKDVFKIFAFSFASGVIVSLWGTSEHFGVSPSCLFITGQANVDCWIQDVKSRVFATLGQPNWMAAYLDILILSGIGFIAKFKLQNADSKDQKTETKFAIFSLQSAMTVLVPLFFAALLFTKSRSGLLGLFAGIGVIGLGSIITQGKKSLELLKNKSLLILFVLLILLILFLGLPFDKIDKFTIPNLFSSHRVTSVSPKPKALDGYIDIGISESGDIRKIVWKGAINVWKRYPIFGSGVETFAYAYYKDRPIEHNNVSEWDFLYNKAHNEFLNILATTGTVGFLSYLSILGVFTYWVFKKLKASPLVIALFAAYASILVTNFFGFSVVIIGIYFFLIPGFCLLLSQQEISESVPSVSVKSVKNPLKYVALSSGQKIGIVIITLTALVFEWNLLKMWQADEAFAYGKNLDGVQQYSQATPYLLKAVETNGSEPTFTDELSFNEAFLTSQLYEQSTGSAQEKLSQVQPYLNLTIKSSDSTVNASPNNVVFWKTRTKVFYQLAGIDSQYIVQALTAISKAVELAPTDPKIRYNYGLILGRVGQTKEAIKAFEDTVALKADYADAHYALGLYYAQNGQKDKAREQMEFILKRIGKDERAIKWLEDNPK